MGDFAIEAYFTTLQELTSAQWDAAAMKALKTCKFMPAPAELLELAGKGDDTEQRAAYVLDESILQEQLNAAGRSDLATALTNGGGGVDSGSIGLEGVDQELVRRVEAIRRKGDPIGLYLSITRR